MTLADEIEAKIRDLWYIAQGGRLTKEEADKLINMLEDYKNNLLFASMQDRWGRK